MRTRIITERRGDLWRASCGDIAAWSRSKHRAVLAVLRVLVWPEREAV